VISEGSGKKERFFFALLFVAGPDVGDTQAKEAMHSVEIRRCFKEHLWLVGSWAAAGIENDPRISQLDVTGIFRLDQLPAKNPDIEVLRFALVAHGEEVSCEEASLWNRRVREIHAVPPVVDKSGCGRKCRWSKGSVSSAGLPGTGS